MYSSDFDASLASPIDARTNTKLAIAKLIRDKAKKAVKVILCALVFSGQQSFAAERTPKTPVSVATHPPQRPPPI